MNQKNIFSVIAALLILQGIFFLVLGDKMVTDTFPGVDETGHHSLIILMQVPAALLILIGIIMYANRTTPNIARAFTLGFGVLVVVTYKHLLIDHVNVPMMAVVLQTLILLACGFFWSQEKKV
jgi:hypothetical protein